jgi:hypothetical protein
LQERKAAFDARNWSKCEVLTGSKDVCSLRKTGNGLRTPETVLLTQMRRAVHRSFDRLIGELMKGGDPGTCVA